MKNQKTVKVTESIFHIFESLDVYCTLIVGSESALLVDTGYGFGDISSKVREITELPVKVIITHGHVDHILGNGFFSGIMLHREDAGLMKFQSSFPVKLFVYLAERKNLKTEERKNRSLFFRKSYRKPRYVNDGDLIDLGDRVLEVIHTPGHTRGSVCILDKKDRVLISGDTISNNIWLFRKEAASIKAFRDCLSKLAKRKAEFDSILFSHSEILYNPVLPEKILNCLEHMDFSKSRPHKFHLAGKALVYAEGLEKMQKKYGYGTFEEIQRHLDEIDQKDMADGAYISIAYPAKNASR